MKLTFSCHCDQVGQKNPTQCYQTEIKQLNLGIYFKKKKVNLVNVPSKAEIKTVKTKEKAAPSGPILNCVCTGLKFTSSGGFDE